MILHLIINQAYDHFLLHQIKTDCLHFADKLLQGISYKHAKYSVFYLYKSWLYIYKYCHISRTQLHIDVFPTGLKSFNSQRCHPVKAMATQFKSHLISKGRKNIHAECDGVPTGSSRILIDNVPCDMAESYGIVAAGICLYLGNIIKSLIWARNNINPKTNDNALNIACPLSSPTTVRCICKLTNTTIKAFLKDVANQGRHKKT